MVDFNPFDKPLEEIEFEDLQQLQEQGVSEGYYVEYKRTIPGSEPGRTIGKVIASFANTYGGWFLLGVPESFNNEAGKPIGINVEENRQIKETVRRWVSSRVDPNPEFGSHLIQNPESEDYAVLVIEVPESRHPPHIMSDGVIYRRSGEESDPIEPETDRWALDRLYEDRRERERKQQRVLQHLRALNKELELNQESAYGTVRVIRTLQQASQQEADHYALELFSTDAWNAALEEQLIDIISNEVYQELQQLYKQTKSANELIKRLRTEVLHPSIGEEINEDWAGSYTNWTISVLYWNDDKDEVDFYGLGVLIWKKVENLKRSIDGILQDIESEIQRLEEELNIRE